MYEAPILSRLQGLMYIKSDWIQEICGQQMIYHVSTKNYVVSLISISSLVKSVN